MDDHGERRAGDRSRRLLAHQARILDLIARGVRVEETLAAIVGVARSELPVSHCTVLAAVGKRPMRHLVTSDLPAEWIDEVEQELTGPVATAVGAPTGRLTKVDIANDPRWASCAPALLARGLRCAWVVPVVSLAEDRMLGAIVAYTGHDLAPDAVAEQWLATLTRLAAVAIGHGRLQQRLAAHALRDELTGLPTRALFHDRVDQALARAERSSRSVAVVVVDMARIGAVNQEFGHRAGDDALAEVARRLERMTRTGETVARLEGGDFAILCEDLEPRAARASALACAARVYAAVRQPLAVHGGRRVLLDAAIGIAIGGGAASPDDLLRDADAAAYAAKRTRTGAPVVAEPETALAPARLSTVTSLHRALERHELCVHYQPIVDLASRRCTGAEALVRWNHPEHGLVLPAEFIGVAEDSGLILAIGDAVLDTVLRDSSELGLTAPFSMSVNLSARQLRREFVDQLAERLVASGVPPELLAFEITESVLLDDLPRSCELLGAIRDLGVRLSIDDFGTGYSSLEYLRRLPVDTVKVDRSFVVGLGEHVEDAAIVGAVVSLAHSLGLRVVAEGVETATQLHELVDRGCDAAQGFLFAPPVGRPHADALLDPSRVFDGEGVATAT